MTTPGTPSADWRANSSLLDPDTAPALPLWAEPELIVRESSGPAPLRRDRPAASF